MRRATTGPPSSETVQQLWESYSETGDIARRNRLVLTLAPMVKYIVTRKAREIPGHCDIEDLVSCGLEALILLLDRYDPSKGLTLEQFAWTRIHGAVLDELRRGDWAPRSVRRWERDIARARQTFVATHGRAPTHEALAEAVNLTSSELDRWLRDVHRADVGSLNVFVTGDDDHDTRIEHIEALSNQDADLDPEQRVVRDHAKERFRAAFDQLPERQRQVAVRLYLHDMTLREIGHTLGVTESRVCQIHAELRRRLRELLAADELLFEEAA